MSKLVPIDFEYNTTNEQILNLVSCSYSVSTESHGQQNHEHWLYNNKGAKLALKEKLLQLRDEGYVFLAYNVIAEGHAFISLGIDPTKCKWLDLAQEWKMITNHYHKYMYGKHLIDGREVFTSPPKYGEDSGVSNAKPPKNLAGCLYRLLGIKIDTNHKNEMRDIIISNDRELINLNKKNIIDYCTSDIVHLIPAWKVIREEYLTYFKRAWKYTKEEMELLELPFEENEPIEITYEEIFWRGETAARTALMQATGYPVNVEKVKKFAGSVKTLLKDLCEDINEQFEEGERFFKWNSSQQRYSMYQKPLKDWIANSKYAGQWKRTAPSKTKPNGDWSLALDAWEKHFSYRHDYPRGNVGAQLLRYLKTRQSLNGFLPKSPTAKNKETFFDSLGKDGRVRSYLNPYGAQSARYQPKATGFIPLKAAWMRSLIEPKPGYAICGIDYGSQEFLIGALVSGDKNMLEAYKSGDVYLYFAKLAGAVPWDGTKKEYAAERNVFKSTTLGISYSMGAAALARKLTDDTGKPHTQQDAQDLIDKFMKAYPDYANWIENIRFDYALRGFHKLPDGWVIFGDNDNKRSISNVPIQGFGSCILRKAVQLCQDRGLKVCFTLHDAVTVEYCDESDIDTLAECMREAFCYYFDNKEGANLIRLDANIWGPRYPEEEGELISPGGVVCKRQNIYVDDRSRNEYNKFKKYMEI